MPDSRMGIVTRLSTFLLLLFVLALPTMVRAQGPDIHIVHLQSDVAVNILQEKQAREMLWQLDPDSRFSVHADRLRLKVGTRGTVQVSDIQAALAGVGITATVISPPLPPAGIAKNSDPMPVGFPVYIDTGDRNLDNQNYMAAKAAWVAAHPSDYLRITGGLSDQ